jgi:hypothetical protein
MWPLQIRHREYTAWPFMGSGISASELVGRPGLDPGTLGLKVQVRALQRVSHRRTKSQTCWSEHEFGNRVRRAGAA